MFSAEVQVMVSFMRDSSMTGQRLRRGSVRRILSYARPYRVGIGVYLAMTVLSAGILTAVPVLLQVIIDHGILRRDTAVVLWTAGTVAGLAAVNALLEVGQRWYSARVNLTSTSRDAPGAAPSRPTHSIAPTTSSCRITIDNLALSHERVERPGADRARAAAVR
jgi:hypothetical protein